MHHRLGLALRHYLGSAWTLRQSRMRDWASATFCGARHFIALSHDISSDEDRADLEKKLAALVDQDFDMAGHLVADIGVDSHACDTIDGVSHHHIVIHILTVEVE